jgi:uncharacterized protein (TIGR02996 family)
VSSTLAPPRPELVALLDAVKDDPDDDTPRLVLADWLDEQGGALDAERAKYIRGSIMRERGGKSRPLAKSVGGREIIRRMLGPLPTLAYAWRFTRGLPALYVNGPHFFNAHVPELLAGEAFAFVQFVHLAETGGPRMEAMAAMPEFRYVPGIALHPFSPLGAESAARVFASPNLTGLRQIEFRSVQPGAVGMQALAANAAFSRLRTLRLAHNKLVDKAAVALASGVHLLKLEVLDLSDNLIGDKGAEALAASPTLANLRELDLRENPRLTDRGKQLLRGRFGDRVKVS